MGEKVFIARQDTLEEVQATAEAIQTAQTNAGTGIANLKTDTESLKLTIQQMQTAQTSAGTKINNIKTDTESIKNSVQKIAAKGQGLQVHFPKTQTRAYYMTVNLPWNLTYDSILVPDGAKTHILTEGKYYIFNKDTMTYTTGKTPPHNTSGGCGAVLNGILHIFGGAGGTKKHIAYENGAWKTKADVSYAMTAGGAVVYNGKIYLAPPSSVILEWNQTADTYSVITSSRHFSATYAGVGCSGKYLHIVGGTGYGQKHDIINLETKQVEAGVDLPVIFSRQNGDYLIFYHAGLSFLQACIRSEALKQRNTIYSIPSTSNAAATKGTGSSDNGQLPSGELAREIYGSLGFAFRSGRVDIPSYVFAFWLPKGSKIYYPSSLFIFGEKIVQNTTTKVYEQVSDGEVQMLCHGTYFEDLSKTIIYGG